MKKNYPKILVVLILIIGGVFLVSKFTGLTLPGVNVTQTQFDLSGVVPSGLLYYFTFDGADLDLASTTGEVINRGSSSLRGDRKSSITTPVIGKIGQGFSFFTTCCSATYVGISAAMPTAYTKAAWVYFKSAPSSAQNNIISGDNNHALWTGSTNDISGGHNGSYALVKTGIANNSVAANRWYHVALTYDGSSALTIYLDGVQKAW